ncbi:MAG: condensation domain-containing protein, partial [Gemmatimonadota bacterium]
MLFHALYAPESGVYVGQFGFVLEGPLDVPALERAWWGVVERHEALRAGFAWEGLPRPVQVVRRAAELPFRVEDWRGLDAAERQARLARHLETDRSAGFELGRVPLMRLALFRVGEAEHRLVWTHHHLVVDGWSLSLIFRDVLAAYGAHARGKAPRPAPGRRYRDYVAWLERQDRSGAERFWRRTLAGFEVPTPFPVERRAGGAEWGHGMAHLLLGEEPTRALQERARGLGVTMGTLVQGAWALLLGRYAGEEDVVFGATVSGRPPELPGVEETVGLFINTLPVRVRLDGGVRVGDWLARLQRGQVEAREHEYAPLVEVQRWSDVPSGEALFRSLVVFENYPVDQVAAEAADGPGGLRVRAELADERTSYPLVLTAHVGARLKAELRYDGVRVEPEAVERLAGHLEVLLEVLAADPERRLSEVSLLRDAEWAQLRAWNDTAAEFPRACIHDLFGEQASRTPAATAVRRGDEVLDYAGLERRSSRLAHLLRRHGVGPETRVGVCMERGVDAVAAILSVLKAGGAYVPLDPANPAARLQEIVADADVSTVLTHAATAAKLPAGIRALRLDEPETAAELAALPATPPPVPSDPLQLAYVVYTSGSTGRPKGVAVSHASGVGRVGPTPHQPHGAA